MSARMVDHIERLHQDITALRAVKEAYRYFIDAHDNELAEAGITRADALARARDLDAALAGGGDGRSDGTNL